MQIIINFDREYIVLYINTNVFTNAGPQRPVFAFEHHLSAECFWQIEWHGAFMHLALVPISIDTSYICFLSLFLHVLVGPKAHTKLRASIRQPIPRVCCDICPLCSASGPHLLFA